MSRQSNNLEFIKGVSDSIKAGEVKDCNPLIVAVLLDISYSLAIIADGYKQAEEVTSHGDN